jgi:hypothetical protein
VVCNSPIQSASKCLLVVSPITLRVVFLHTSLPAAKLRELLTQSRSSSRGSAETPCCSMVYSGVAWESTPFGGSLLLGVSPWGSVEVPQLREGRSHCGRYRAYGGAPSEETLQNIYIIPHRERLNFFVGLCSLSFTDKCHIDKVLITSQRVKRTCSIAPEAVPAYTIQHNVGNGKDQVSDLSKDVE